MSCMADFFIVTAASVWMLSLLLDILSYASHFLHASLSFSNFRAIRRLPFLNLILRIAFSSPLQPYIAPFHDNTNCSVQKLLLSRFFNHTVLHLCFFSCRLSTSSPNSRLSPIGISPYITRAATMPPRACAATSTRSARACVRCLGYLTWGKRSPAWGEGEA